LQAKEASDGGGGGSTEIHANSGSYPQMSAATQARLEDFYSPHADRLKTLLGYVPWEVGSGAQSALTPTASPKASHETDALAVEKTILSMEYSGYTPTLEQP
jgi:hypothetical protein